MSELSSTAERARVPEESVATRHYVFLGFLTLLNVMNFVDRQLLASFANFVKPDLNLSNTEFGLLTGLVFLFFYSVMGVPMGILADRVNRTRFIAFGLALWSALTAVSGLARGFWSLAAPRMLIGIGESIMTPTSMSLLADRFPATRLGFAAGAYYMGVPIGVAASMLVGAYLEPLIGWRGCFYLLGAIGVGFALVMWFIRETPRKGLTTPAAQRPTFGEMLRTFWQAVRRSRALQLTVAGGVATHFILGAATFDQLWFVEERGFDRNEILGWSGWLAFFGGVAGNLFGGMGSDWFMRKTGQGRAMFLFWILLVLAPFGVIYRLIEPSNVLFWVGMFLGFFQLGSFYGPTFATVQDLVPPQIRATVVGFYIMVLNIIGLGLGITLGGICIDLLIARGVSEPYTWTLLVFTLLSLTALPMFFVAGRLYQRDRARLAAELTE